jgi:type VI secretion system protein ImpJ
MKPFWPRSRQLLPVHVQARDAYVEELLRVRLEAIRPQSYGVFELKVDDAAWARGTIALKSFSALFPSGLFVVRTTSISRSNGSLQRGQSSLFLAVPRTVLRGPNVAADNATEGSARYRARRDKDPPRLEPEVRLLFESEITGDVEAIFLGRVEQTGTRVQWEKGSTPTVARVRASAVLQSGLEQLVRGFEQRKRELLRTRAERPFRMLELTSFDVPSLELLVIVQRYLPLLADAATRPSLQPGELHELLTSIHGSLAVFAPEDRAGPRFSYERPRESIMWLVSEIRTILDEAARDRTTVLPFERVDASTFKLSFDREWLVGKRPILVASGVDEPFLRDRIPTLLKMASPAAMPSLLQSALRGVAVAPEFEPFAAIPRRPDLLAYRVDVRDPLWLDIEDRRAIVLYVPQAPPTLTFVLYGIERLT